MKSIFLSLLIGLLCACNTSSDQIETNPVPISRERVLEKQEIRNAEPKLIKEYLEKGYNFSSPMTSEEATLHYNTSLEASLEDIKKYFDEKRVKEIIPEVAAKSQIRWQNYLNKMNAGDKIAYLKTSNTQKGEFTSWEGYVIIRGEYFLHSYPILISN